MDHIAVIKRAFHITWRYRMLWIFGVLLAIFSGTASGGGGGNTGFQFNGQDMNLPRGLSPNMPDPAQVVGLILALGLILLVVAVFFSLISVVVRYVSETAVIRAVDEHETTGEKRSFGYTFRLGWSRGAWRLFLIDLVVGIPTGVVFIVLFLLALSPLLLWVTGSDTAGIIGTVATIGLMVVVGMAGILVAIVLSLLKPFFWRACLLEDLGVFDSIRRGYRVVRTRLADAGVMWIILVGLEIAWSILLVPVMIVIVILGLMVGGGLGLVVGLLAGLVFPGTLPYILGALVGVPLVILVVGVPAVFLSALWVIFKSTTWTLTYRELAA